MRKFASVLVGLSILALTGCFPIGGGGLRAVIVTDPNPPRGPWPLTVEFDGTHSIGDIEQYLWDFGDGATAAGPVVTHTYQYPGKYTVYLTVLTSGGSSRQAKVTVDVRSQYPIAEFEVWRTGKGSEILFDASASYDPDGKIKWYIWDFGDGSTWFTTDPEVKHTYPGDGVYTVTLVVEDDNGDRSAPVQHEVVISGSCGSCG
jgi:PKD repeat protein